MFIWLLKNKANLFSQNQDARTFWLIIVTFAIVITLEYTTPSDYVFGYLYTGPILLANPRLNRSATLVVTLLACTLTLLNLVFPNVEHTNPATVANRLIAMIALVVTGILSNRTRRYEEAIARQEAKLRSQETLARVREDFASTLTHDLKTPLLGAIETLKSLQQKHFGEVTLPQQKVFTMMISSHQSTLQMVETLLDVYRNDTEGLKLQLTDVNLVTLAEYAIATLTDLASTRRVYLCLSHGTSNFRQSIWVKGDPLQLQRVINNLLINSINHSPRGGKVEVVLESDATNSIVKIIDRGPGITQNELPYLFEQFYQGNTHRQAKGSGLGLYLSRQIIEAHGGTIWAENRTPQGALFGFRLPACFRGIGE
ncbi:MAG TPA: two-component sensor histidine kinase [Cyanobacteria bacterium UBA11149]|nr:two-component sensor histidine kinase [Cyanobacteria bacterium UBA11367]HBE56662.1 two-component sensor histidine kinase [Cyanobacteria bacterium UBA11366]HBK66362.1 two-component sensor histidine kinase [Cyanobacteria bacterium UBA11166]HBR74128.1 two-component sensor histidine kinase [Cyanobacteria bacterium UBA11159]HBS71345.1 two-component sensor histidine kinase [Cyanobacteria bacterium UBA11153]HBW87626.1 two-component sensor histidine kinase [Cyanobacteria bacterium UBA11149]HCA9509